MGRQGFGGQANLGQGNVRHENPGWDAGIRRYRPSRGLVFAGCLTDDCLEHATGGTEIVQVTGFGAPGYLVQPADGRRFETSFRREQRLQPNLPHGCVVASWLRDRRQPHHI